MKKFYILTIVLVLLITITGCGKTKNKEPEKTEFSLGEKIEIKNFEIEFLNYSLRKAISEKEKHQDLVFLEVNVTNTTSKTQSFRNSNFKVFGPDNLQLDIISSNKYTSALSNLGNIRSNGTTNGHIIFEFSGYGKYYLEFVNTSKKKITVIINIDQPNAE